MMLGVRRYPIFGLIGSLMTVRSVAGGECDDVLASLRSWPGLQAEAHRMLCEDLAAAGKAEKSTVVAIGDRRLYVAHIGWSVVLVELSESCEIERGVSHHAKLGFSIRPGPKSGVIVTLHEHAGTGLWWDQPLSVTEHAGHLEIKELPGRNPSEEASE